MNRNEDFSEEVNYNVKNLPLLVSHEYLSELPTYRELVHWHTDFEFIMVTDGVLDFFVNEKTVHIKCGQGLFVNSNRLHFGYSEEKKEVLFDLVIVSPQLIETPFNRGNILALCDSGNADYLIFDKYSRIWELLYSIMENGFGQTEILKLQSDLCLMAYELHSICQPNGQGETESARILRKMLMFIRKNYPKKITVSEISKAGAIGRSMCFSLFREYMGVTPLQYLTQFRLSKGAEFLLDNKSVAEASQMCGFSTQSHFTKVFHEIYGMTPKEYQKHYRPKGNCQ